MDHYVFVYLLFIKKCFYLLKNVFQIKILKTENLHILSFFDRIIINNFKILFLLIIFLNIYIYIHLINL